jgi:DNA-binding NtrC family response regulator
MAVAATAVAPQIPIGIGQGLPVRVLFVEDNQQDVELCTRELERAGFKVSATTTSSAREFLQAVCSQAFDVILSDYGLPGWHGDEVIAMVREQGAEIPVVMVTGSLGDEKAVDMIKMGAADFVLKERLARLPLAVHRALREKKIPRRTPPG